VLNRSGVTLIEVAVSMAVVGIIAAVLLPAVQAARESARLTQCSNQVRQLALATHQFENTFQQLPTNGWGFRWLGDASQGSLADQPGGWLFQILPFLELKQLYDVTLATDAVTRRERIKQLAMTPVGEFRCPSRPGQTLQPHTTVFSLLNAETPQDCGRTDYAINEGDYLSDSGAGPLDTKSETLAQYPWVKTSLVTGVSWERGSASLATIKDGTSNVYLCGEKRVCQSGYDNATDLGYDQSPFTGVDIDIARWVVEAPAADSLTMELLERRFGSAHPTGCVMAMADGSIRKIAYSIHPEIHRSLGNRRDGNPKEIP